MEPGRTLSLDCPAKVNLALSIGSPLPNGYHPLASWMVAVRFADRLELAAGTDGSSRFELSFDATAPVPGRVDWPLEKDLGFRAHALLESHVRRRLPVQVRLLKKIPAGAGLGGGSSNAAAVLVGVNRLLGLSLDAATLRGLGQKLGSDVGFLVGALSGAASAIVTGLGEMLEPAPLRAPVHLVLIFPGFGCPTGPVYGAFDQLHAGGATRRPEVERVCAFAAAVPVAPHGPFNDLAQSACVIRPELAALQAKASATLKCPVHITGSGSTLFAIAPDADAACAMAGAVTAATGLAAVATQTLN